MALKTITGIISICVPFMILTIWAIIDVARKDFGTIQKKALWWIIASIPFIGCIVYLAFGFRKGIKTDEQETEGALK